MRFLCLLVLILPAQAAVEVQPASELAGALRQLTFDAKQCYRIRDLSFGKDEARFFLSDGYLMLAKPVDGKIIAALFTTTVEGGDAEVLLLPPHRRERISLASFTKSPNLSEHVKAALLIFTDDTANQLVSRVGELPPAEEMGLLTAQTWDPVLRNLLQSFEVRLIQDLLSPGSASAGFFFAALAGASLGNFDFMYDPRSRQQITMGQVAFRDTAAYFDVWTNFEARSFRQGARKTPGVEFKLSDFRIDAHLDAELKMRATTRVKLTPAVAGERAITLDISRRARVTQALIDGAPAEVFQRESLRANLLRGGDNEMFLVIAPAPLEAGRTYELELRHEGEVVRTVGKRVFSIESRPNWYPNRNHQFALYDLTFRYPASLKLVATGDIVEEKTEGDEVITRRRTSAPVRLAGFNLGEYEKTELQRGDMRVEVYANRNVEDALQRSREFIIIPAPAPSPLRRGPVQSRAAVVSLPSIPPTSPAARLEKLADDTASALEYMRAFLGPPVLPLLTVTPIPGAFGQGFPGLLYLSTISYLDPTERPAALRGGDQRMFFSDILNAHETAHQWWGNIVTAETYEDDWLMEALANYTALMFIETRLGTRALDEVLNRYRENLAAPLPDAGAVESAGPLSWGARLLSSKAPGAWRTITYEKGSWVIHMLRRKLGDTAFRKMLSELVEKHGFGAINNEQFRAAAAAHLPANSPDPKLENFFEHWVHGVGIPKLSLKHAIKPAGAGFQLRMTLAQSGVNEDFSVDVPVEIQYDKGRSEVRWIRSSFEPVTIQATLKQRPIKVVLDSLNAVLAMK